MARLTAKDRRRFEQARKRGRRHALRPAAVVRARYNAVRDALELVFRSGKVVAIPRTLLPGLKGARMSTLKAVSVSPAGDAISWRKRDIDVSVRGLLKCATESRESAIRRQPRVLPRLPKAERYTPGRKGQFLLENAATAAEYRAARREVKSLGLDPDAIPHVRPTSR
jgi:hypothetical protein